MKTTHTHTMFHHGLAAMLGVTQRLVTIVARTPDTIYDWQRRARTRHQLMAMNDRLLKDMGMSRYDALHEGSKPFWKD